MLAVAFLAEDAGALSPLLALLILHGGDPGSSGQPSSTFLPFVGLRLSVVDCVDVALGLALTTLAELEQVLASREVHDGVAGLVQLEARPLVKDQLDWVELGQ